MVARSVIEPEDMLPAVAQGAIGIELRDDDAPTRARLAALDHAPTALALTAERAFLARLEGSCRTPIGGLAEPAGLGRLRLRGQILTPDGREAHETTVEGPDADAARLGVAAAEALLARVGPGFFTAT